MYQPSDEFQLKAFQIVRPADNATNFGKSDVIRFTIPARTGFFDSKLSKLQFNLRVDDATVKMCLLDDKIGIGGLIDMVRVTQNGTVLTEVLDYATIARLITTFEKSDAMLQAESTYKGLVDDVWKTGKTAVNQTTDNFFQGQSINGSGVTSISVCNAKESKYQLSLDFIGLFETMSAVPCILMGDLLLEIRIRDSDQKMIKCLPSTGKYYASTPAGGAVTTSTISPASFESFESLEDSPFIVGMTIEHYTDSAGAGGSGAVLVSALSQDASTKVITITHASVDTTGTAFLKITLAAGGGSAPSINTTLVITKAELQLQVIQPPAQYVSNLMKQSSTDGLIIDIPNWTAYRSQLLAITSQTLTVQSTQSRALSMFTIFQNGTGVWEFDNSTDHTNNGKFSNISEYRTQINGMYYPQQPVSCKKYIAGHHFSQEHVRELEKALKSSSIKVNSIKQAKQNFTVPRALGVMGSSMDLTSTPINIYLTHSSAPTQSDAFTYINHLTRIMIGNGTIEVMN